MRSIGLALLGVLAWSNVAGARSVVPPPPHNPLLVKCRLNEIVAAINAKDRSLFPSKMRIISEKYGLVEDDEFDGFFHEFAASDEKYKNTSLELNGSGFVHVSPGGPVYAISLRRGVGEGGHWSTWIVSFNLNEVSRMRRADEMWPFTNDYNIFYSVEGCSGEKQNG